MDYKELLAYKKSFEIAMEIFELSKIFPTEEKYSLTDQIRRSSRSVTANIAEAYRKRRYMNHFISKLTDSDAENSETNTWLEFSLACKYISKEVFESLNTKNIEIGKLINYMINNPTKFGCQNNKTEKLKTQPSLKTETEN
ncbi:four helix bundle protein [Flavobacterium gelatinilyticum]|uniref:four helix bundle protein n=1 Tax=Flavobacterium gelatinilyticum TaxID=3003260 RepID=UPI00247FE951|nr:four helix bundle protein [Flavobacterium gelatinilyticum]